MTKNHISLARIVHMAPLNGAKNSKYQASRRWRFLFLFKVAQSCPNLCDPMDYNPPGSTALGILQARILEWVAVPSPGDLPNPGIEPKSPALQADSLPAEPQREAHNKL